MQPIKLITFVLIYLIQLNESMETNINRIGRKQNIIEMIKSIVENEDIPTNLFIHTSTEWTNSENSEFFKIIPMQSVIFLMNSKISLNQLFQKQNPNEILFICDLTNNNNGFEFINGFDQKYFRHPYRWILLLDDFSDKMQFQQLINKIDCLTDSNIIVANFMNGNATEIELNQIYKIDEHSSVLYEMFGHWNSQNGLTDLRTTRILSRRRKNLMGKIITASVVLTNNNSIEHLTDYKEKHVDSIAKVNYIYSNQLIEILNGTAAFTFTGTWGYRDVKSGEWGGMVGELVRKKAVLGGTALFITPDRVEFIEYISMTIPSRSKFVFRAPPLSYVTNIYYLPFEGLVWICGGCLVIFSIIIVYLTYCFVQNKYFNDEHVHFADTFLLGIGAICQMGSQLHPRILSGRISTLFLFIALLFMYTSYTANIVALLQSTTKSITSLYDLLHSQLELGVDDTPYNRYYFPAATEPIRQAIYKTKILKNKQSATFVNISYGVSRMRQGLYAFQMEMGQGYKLVEETFYEHEKCGLIEIAFIEVIDPWYSIQKHSPYKEMLKVNLFKIREHGMQSREYSKIYTKKPVCDSRGQNFGSVRLIDCYAALLVLAYGLIASTFVLIIEKITYKRKAATTTIGLIPFNMNSEID